MCWWNSRFCVRDGALVGDLRDAVHPVVWRMELARVHSAAFSVEQNGSVWELGVEGPKGEFTPIAGYKSRKLADRALRRLAAGLRRTGTGKRMSSWFLILLVLVGGYWGVTKIAARFSSGSGTTSVASGTAPQVGQSMSADDALRLPGQR